MTKHVLIVKGRPAAKFAALDHAFESAGPGRHLVISSPDDLRKLSKRAKLKIYRYLLTINTPAQITNQELFNMLQTMDYPDFRKKIAKPKGPSVREKVRELLENGQEYSLDELVTKLRTAKSTITTAISDLRSDNYCGPKGPMNIVRTMGGYQYVRE